MSLCLLRSRSQNCNKNCSSKLVGPENSNCSSYPRRTPSAIIWRQNGWFTNCSLGPPGVRGVLLLTSFRYMPCALLWSLGVFLNTFWKYECAWCLLNGARSSTRNGSLVEPTAAFQYIVRVVMTMFVTTLVLCSFDVSVASARSSSRTLRGVKHECLRSHSSSKPSKMKAKSPCRSRCSNSDLLICRLWLHLWNEFSIISQSPSKDASWSLSQCEDSTWTGTTLRLSLLSASILASLLANVVFPTPAAARTTLIGRFSLSPL